MINGTKRSPLIATHFSESETGWQFIMIFSIDSSIFVVKSTKVKKIPVTACQSQRWCLEIAPFVSSKPPIT